MEKIKMMAAELSRDFLENDKEYRLGFIEAEQSNEKTKRLGETFRESSKKGIELLLSVDKDLVPLFRATLFSECFDHFCDDIEKSLKAGGRIVLSGCGSTGRLSLRVEASFREAIGALSCERPELRQYLDSVVTVMTGGDYAIIRAVESFEDYTSLGMLQVDELDLNEKDILVGITATAETTSIIGTALGALDRGSKCYMVVCTDPESIKGKLSRVDKVYNHENTRSIYMKVGGMAVTGSTRMQSSTIEQTIILSALEIVLERLASGNKANDEATKIKLISGFRHMLASLCLPENLGPMAEQIEAECEIYENGGLVTYFADEYLLDILADTTERGPTFSLPTFRPAGDNSSPISWAFVKNPNATTEVAWERSLLHTPRCIDKSEDEYRALGILESDIKKIPEINLNAILRFRIGNEREIEREGKNTLATVVGADLSGDECELSGYEMTTKVKFIYRSNTDISSRLHIFEHIAAKLMMNIISTGTMARLGRVYGNYMVYLKISNKKLIDRATRIVADLGGVDYETANRLIFEAKILIDEEKTDKPAVLCALELLERERKNDSKA